MTYGGYGYDPQGNRTTYAGTPRRVESPSSALNFTGWGLPNQWWRNIPMGYQVEQGWNQAQGATALIQSLLGGGQPAPTGGGYGGGYVPGYTKGMSSGYGVGQTPTPPSEFGNKEGGWRAAYNAYQPAPGDPAAVAANLAADAAARAQTVGQLSPGYRFPTSPTYDFVSEGKDVVQDYWQEQYDRYIAGLRATEDEIRAGYSPTLEGIEDEIGDLRRAAAAVGEPFDEYLARRQGIGAGVGDADPLTGTALDELDGIYDDAEASMRGVMKQIGTNFGPQVKQQLAGRVRQYEDVMEDVIRTDEAAVDLVHTKNAEYAKALAQAAYSNDVYAALDAETRINATLDNRTKEAQEELARQKKARDAALAAARAKYQAEFEMGNPDFDTVLQQTWNEYFEAQGVPQHQRARAMEIFTALSESPENMLNENSFRRGLNEYMNQSVLSSLGVSQDDISARIQAGADPNIIRSLSSYDFGRMFQSGQTNVIRGILTDLQYAPNEVNRIINEGLRNADQFMTSRSPETQHLRNMYTSRTEISESWDEIAGSFGPPVNSADVIQITPDYHNPVVGGASFSNDWGNPRSGGRTHEGTDMFAARGTPIVSPVNGTVISIDYGNLGGKYVKVRDANGNVHYLAHMDTQSPNISVGQRVYGGRTVLGTVGNTGNARGTDPHLHYGIYTSRGATNPYNWLQGAPGSYQGSRSSRSSSSSSGGRRSPTRHAGSGGYQE